MGIHSGYRKVARRLSVVSVLVFVMAALPSWSEKLQPTDAD